ncbi:MAG: AMP-binding protein [Odoribacteraceae bacterium]|jgi:O-succinylbenzoic acid--CoA ligase|nr:AMP-binding protein [Odoribacteraceae bacterium]
MGTAIHDEVEAFLAEWTDDREHVTGHTSGSTGPARRVDLPKRDMLASAALTNDFFGITSRSTLLLCLSPAYIAGKMMIVRARLAGARLVAVEPGGDPLAALDGPVDLAAMVPLQVAKGLSRPGGWSLLRQVIIGGAALDPALEGRLREVPTACYASYGMTETASHVALRRVNGPLASPLYVALGETRFATDDRGCLVIDAPHLQQRRVVTNDLVRLVDPARFEWLGRVDHVINSGGVKLSPEVIEARLAPLLSRRFFITAEPDPRLGERVLLVVEGPPWREDERARLVERFSGVLSPRERPRAIRFLPAFCETPSGKLLRTLE